MSEGNKTLVAALDLMRRLPPAQIETNLQFTLSLVPDLADDLLQTVDVPLKVATDKEADRDYLLCDYNRDGDSYRSPWTNKYFPELEDGRLPSKKLRDMEIAANQVFYSYCQAYFDGGISSCYFWETNDNGFAACIVFKKDGSKKRDLDSGIWDSIHIVEVNETSKDKAKYRLSTTIILSLANKSNTLDLSGSIQRQHEEELKFDYKFNNHIVNIGNIIQNMENKLYDQLQLVYFDKAREITRTLRSVQSKKDNQNQMLLQNELFNALNNRKR
jgi:capping protein beta